MRRLNQVLIVNRITDEILVVAFLAERRVQEQLLALGELAIESCLFH